MASIALENALYAEEREANRLKDEFLATLSHELRTPLNAIFGWTQVLRAGPALDADVGHALEIIERNVKVQSRLIEDLLDVSRITTGKLRLSVRQTPLAPIIEGAIESIRPAADLKCISVDCDIPQELGEINADPDRLQQVIWNLLSNAIKFTSEGGAVRVQVERAGGVVRIRVIDNGAGIHPAFLPHVFDPFRQADSSTTRRHGGLGLGLTIVRQIVEMHGGSVHAHSEGEGKGATFTIELPERASKSVRSSGIRPAGAAPGAKAGFENLPDLGGLHVLAVDDDADARDLIRHVLSRAGANVQVVASAREAIEQFDRCPPEVLVSDIGMPELDGYGLLRVIRDRGADRGGNVPAIALTAYVREEDRAKMLDAGFTAQVAKPLEPPELVRVVSRLTEASRRLCPGKA
jgi:CheY-like chemotaxis protein